MRILLSRGIGMRLRLLAIMVLFCLASLSLHDRTSKAQLVVSIAAPSAPSASPPSAIPAAKPKYEIVDGHFHFLDFVQETKGMDAFFQAMDKAGVSEAQIMGMPLVKKWDDWVEKRPKYYLDNDSRVYWYSATDFLVARAVQDLPPAKRKRLHPFICGINSSDRNAADHVERMLALYPNFWEGIGEVFCRHDDLTALTYGDVSRADTKAFDRLMDTAAKHDLPILVHSNLGSSWLQQADYLSEIEYAVRKHPDTRVIWAHAGISRRIMIPGHTEILKKMLDKYANLSIDISWVLFEQEIAPNQKLNKDWVTLLDLFPGRFIIGSDVVGTFEQYAPTIQRYYLLLDAVKPETARKVAKDNFLAILPRRVKP